MSGSIALRGVLRLGARPSPAVPRPFRGSGLVWIGEIRDRVTDALTDPVDASDLAFVFRQVGSDVEFDVTWVKQATGVYACPFAGAGAGTWAVRIEGGTPRIAADEKQFVVAPGDFEDEPSIAELVVAGSVAELVVDGDGLFVVEE